MTTRPWVSLTASFTAAWFFVVASVATAAAAQPRDELINRAQAAAPVGDVTPATVTTNPPAGSGRVPPQEQISAVGHTLDEIAFSCAVLVFGLILVVIEAILVAKGKLLELSGFKLIGLTIVVTAGLFVIPAGYSQNQMTPLMGLLGAIAGYLLGKDQPKPENTGNPKP